MVSLARPLSQSTAQLPLSPAGLVLAGWCVQILDTTVGGSGTTRSYHRIDTSPNIYQPGWFIGLITRLRQDNDLGDDELGWLHDLLGIYLAAIAAGNDPTPICEEPLRFITDETSPYPDGRAINWLARNPDRRDYLFLAALHSNLATTLARLLSSRLQALFDVLLTGLNGAAQEFAHDR